MAGRVARRCLATGLALLGACSPARSGDHSAPPPDGPIRYLALGDSYTIGEGVAADQRWPVQLAARLRALGVTVEAPVIIARTGWTTDELSQGIDAAAPQGPYGLVSLLIGVNNQYRGRDVEQYRGEFRALLQRAIALAGGRADRVLVLSIPDWGVTPFAEGRDRARVAREIDAFNAVNREVTAQLGARYVDVTPVSRRPSSDPGWLAPDGLHPGAGMYSEWARLALPEALEATGPR